MTGTARPSSPLPPARLPDVDSGFEQRLIDGIRPIGELFLAHGLHHLFSSGVFDRLTATNSPVAVDDLAAGLGLIPERLAGLLAYLANEGIVTLEDGRAALTPRATAYAEFRSWYTFLVGGYAGTAGQIGDALRLGAPPCTRNGRDVGVGSTEIARFDGMPMTQTLLEDADVRPRTILDLGCGDGRYLVDMCRRMPGVRAWGAEPDAGAFEQAQELVKSEGLADRVELVHAGAEKFLAAPPPGCAPDLLVFGYVLQEILGQQDRGTVVDLLRSVVDTFPDIHIAVIEVDHAIADPAVMRHGLARNFWNIYYLVHYFTNQRLESRAFWEDVFDEAGLHRLGQVTTPVQADSTGVELGYLLSGGRSGA
uniref:Methyltransferase domain-containing protein n=1 Tax=Streptomyces sp. NBC_00008 TaxID=2903610 RepID=A0AAU2VKN7_9ACTN